MVSNDKLGILNYFCFCWQNENITLYTNNHYVQILHRFELHLIVPVAVTRLSRNTPLLSISADLMTTSILARWHFLLVHMLLYTHEVDFAILKVLINKLV